MFTPGDVEELALAVAEAPGGLEVVGGGSKRGWGRPVEGDGLDVRGIAGVVEYDPDELVVTVRTGTPLAEVEAMLLGRRQMLGFEPPDWGGLLGGGAATIGGMVACNHAGPRRVRAGAVRDHLLGFQAVNGSGEVWRAGGRVVKNVTGYDMGKLQAGAFGTLSVLAEVSLRCVPAPERSASVVVRAGDAGAAVRVMAAALRSPHEVSGAAFVPSRGEVLLRVEGHAPSVRARVAGLMALLGGEEMAQSEAAWRDVGSVSSLLLVAGRVVWRVCTVPSLAGAYVEAVRARFGSVEYLLDWGGGLVWLSLEAGEAGADAGAGVVRGLLGEGHATLLVAPEAVRRVVPVFAPLVPAREALETRVKDSFDPRRILNPGRMQEAR